MTSRGLAGLITTMTPVCVCVSWCLHTTALTELGDDWKSVCSLGKLTSQFQCISETA